MKVKVEYLIPGCILSEDIYKKTNTPLMKKKTVLMEDDIDTLKAYLVPFVIVESKLVNGEVFEPKSTINEKSETKTNDSEEPSFIDLYLSAVQQFKKMFSHWQGGTKVDAFKIRKLFLPLYEKLPGKEQLIEIHHYGTKHDYIYFHSVAVGILSACLGKKMNLSNGEIIQLGLAGLLSDCGMTKLPFNVFEKQGPLTVEEYNEVKEHPVVGYRMLEAVPGFSKGALLGVLQHHEREDGTGYPMGLKGEKLHLFAKIISICDIYHAMTSERHYRTKQSPYKVIESLDKDHFGKIDHIILSAFKSMMLDLAIGKKVRLSNGAVGEILFIEDKDPTRPLIKLDETNSLLKLISYPEIFIEELIDEHDDPADN
ncbi:HD domain-containing protein [Evansella caseinilytica]|uniref:HD domain-containing protein n=1 Tax=Evansella caseinilytica TaxID=1503961 RepID=A0A1H3USK3_9BACI|nr:HD-GYP domain-containing protein [Evansella caseinilytica]SDZ65001.1 HD domain-containing protein [Evansella caseinilytica]